MTPTFSYINVEETRVAARQMRKCACGHRYRFHEKHESELCTVKNCKCKGFVPAETVREK